MPPQEIARSVNTLVRCLRFDVPRGAIGFFLVAMNLGYIMVAVHTPMALRPNYTLDDGLFIALGRSIAEGEWLGPYNQYTLMKGPGYPVFLAVANWLGISVSLAHALLHCTAVTFFVLVAHRFIRSLPLSGLLFILLLCHPISLTGAGLLLLVYREEIYYAQVLAVLAAWTCALFCAGELKQRLLYAGSAGALLGWCWITREEGIWILPGLGLLLLAAGVREFRERRFRVLALTLAMTIAGFAVPNLAFRSMNRIAYGSFVGVETKETNFLRALGALHSVRSGGVKPLVSVTRTARERIYAVSPAFASLKPFFDGPRGTDWTIKDCKYIVPCGEIGTGWFVWALRDAAASTGHYASPAAASAFYRQLAQEVEGACARRALECVPQLVSGMPPVDWSDVAQRLPPHYRRAFDLLLFRNPSPDTHNSTGSEELLATTLRFLNYPLHKPSADGMEGAPTYSVRGWYYKAGRAWISAKAKAPDGSFVEASTSRYGSPDAQAMLKDPDASEQRFTIHTRCVAECVLTIEASDGAKFEKSLGEIAKGGGAFALGQGEMHIDGTIVRISPMYVNTRFDEACRRIRAAVLAHYHWIFLPLLFLGAVALVAATVLYPKAAVTNVCYVLGLTCWLLAFIRASLLIVIDLTSFPSLYSFYLAPAYFLLVAASVVSCTAWLQLTGRIPLPQARKLA